MQLTAHTGIFQVASEPYKLNFLQDRPFVSLELPGGERAAELFALSAIQPMQGRDDTTSCSAWRIVEKPGEINVSLEAESSYWEKKVFHFHCLPDRFTYDVEVWGEGDLAEACYFGGTSSAWLRWGSGFFWSGQAFTRAFNPEPSTDEMNYFSPAEGTSVDLMGVPLPGRNHWFFTPPPFCLSFETPNGWIGMGVEAEPGENQYNELAYHARKGAFYLSLAYDGKTPVRGYYRLPAISFDFASDEYQAMGKHIQALRNQNLVPQPRLEMKPLWWYEPIFCGWGAQSALAAVHGSPVQDFSRQPLYDEFLETLENRGVLPGIVVIDDRWQVDYGTNQVNETRWPDMAGFIHRQHLACRHVLLWLKAWDPAGLPLDECITNRSGKAVACDPTNPAYEDRLRKSVRHLLSPDGCGADGFKIDFTARIPAGSGLRLAGSRWGLELIKHYLAIISSEARQVKPDALIMTHTPHPYLADVTDMIRLNDINADKDINQAMAARARLVRTACPEAIIDTDNWPIGGRDAWRKYLAIQTELGVPSLYYTNGFEAGEETLEPEDYLRIREAWQKHREKCMDPEGIGIAWH